MFSAVFVGVSRFDIGGMHLIASHRWCFGTEDTVSRVGAVEITDDGGLILISTQPRRKTGAHHQSLTTCLRYTAARARPWRCACATLSRPHASAMAANILRRVLTTAALARAVASRATETIMGGKGSGSKANKGKGKAQAVMTPVRAVHGCRVPPAVCSMRRASVDCCSNNEFE